MGWWAAAGVALLAAVVLAWRRSLRRARAAQAWLQAELATARQAAKDAEAAASAQSRFIAAAGHDLRQPAQALALDVAALRSGALAPAHAGTVERMAAAVASIESMCSSLLELSQLDAGAVLPQWRAVALSPLLRRLADEAAPAAEARGLRLALRLPPAGATSVTDPLLLERVLRNLLANAVKYTRRGGVLLACRQRAGAWRIEVWDSGVGIAPRQHERVFEEFERLPSPGAPAGQGQGQGLGLASVRRLVQALQLRLVLHSRPGRGSVFFVEGLVPAGAPVLDAAARRDTIAPGHASADR